MRNLRFGICLVLCTVTTAEIPCELYDVTTLVYMTGNYKHNYEVHSRTNAVGLPLDLSNVTGFEDPLERSTLTCVFHKKTSCSAWTMEGFTSTKWRSEDQFMDERDGAFSLSSMHGHIISPLYVAKPGNAEICVSLRYYLDANKEVGLVFTALINNTETLMDSSTVTGLGKVVSESFAIRKPRGFLQHATLKLKINFSKTDSEASFLVRSVRECSSKDRDVLLVSALSFRVEATTPRGKDLKRFPRDQIMRKPEVGFGLRCQRSPAFSTDRNLTGSHITCFNGGTEINGSCQCSPGFIGFFCQYCCPPNRFGADCTGICHPYGYPFDETVSKERDCRGIKLATPGRSLECARGYSGITCEEECGPLSYGPNCNMRCGHCATGSCDSFSGLCIGSCAQGYIGRKCNIRVYSAGRPVVKSVGFDYIEAYLNITIAEDMLQSYPYVDLRYRPQEGKEKSKLLPLRTKIQKFRLTNLLQGENYILYALLIHESGTFYNDTETGVSTKTHCDVCTSISNLYTVSGGRLLTIRWNVDDNCTFPCPRIGYKLEVNSPELAKPIIVDVRADVTQTTLNFTPPSYGSIRLKPVYRTKEGEWSDYGRFSSPYVLEETGDLVVLNKTARSIDILWTKSSIILEDTIMCKVAPLLCTDQQSLEYQQKIRVIGKRFTLDNLRPFTVYDCFLEKDKLRVSTITESELPSGPPNRHPTPLTDVTETTATIHWLDANCSDINGLRKGYHIQLYQNGGFIEESDIGSDDVADSWSKMFAYLDAGISYEARIFVVNHIGFNLEQFLSVPFITSESVILIN